MHSHFDACFKSSGKTDNSIAKTKFSGNLSQVKLIAFDFVTRTGSRMESVETQTFRFMLLIAVQVDFNYSNEALHFRAATNWSERHEFLANKQGTRDFWGEGGYVAKATLKLNFFCFIIIIWLADDIAALSLRPAFCHFALCRE